MRNYISQEKTTSADDILACFLIFYYMCIFISNQHMRPVNVESFFLESISQYHKNVAPVMLMENLFQRQSTVERKGRMIKKKSFKIPSA